MDYVSIDSDGNEVTPRNRSMNDMARQPKTQLQREALEATKTPKLQFEGRDQHKLFMTFEDKASPIDRTENGKKWMAWMQVCIRNANALNRKSRQVNMDALLRNFGDASKMDAWWKALDEKARNEILDKRKNEPVVVPGLQKGTANIHPVTKRRIADEVEQAIAKLEGLLKVNIRRTVPNLDAAQKIVEDGRSIDTWFVWFEQDAWRREHTSVYANLSKVWESWPQGFENEITAIDPSQSRPSSFYG